MRAKDEEVERAVKVNLDAVVAHLRRKAKGYQEVNMPEAQHAMLSAAEEVERGEFLLPDAPERPRMSHPARVLGDMCQCGAPESAHGVGGEGHPFVPMPEAP